MNQIKNQPSRPTVQYRNYPGIDVDFTQVNEDIFKKKRRGNIGMLAIALLAVVMFIIFITYLISRYLDFR